MAAKKAQTDERVKKRTLLQDLLNRPEFGSAGGVLLVFAFFLLISFDSGMFNSDGILNWMVVSAQIGIIAVGAVSLMIAGEFDLSIGSMIAFSGMMIAIPMLFWGWPAWISLLFAFAGAMLLGFLNGYTVMKTGLPSFIVTLAFLYILRGLTIFLAITLTGQTVISGVLERAEGDFLGAVFGAKIFSPVFYQLSDWGIIGQYDDGTPLVSGIPMVIIWWFILVAFASFVLLKTRFGNWVFAVGGDAAAARNMGVPVRFVKISLFMFSAFCATVFAACQVMEFGSAAADRGLLKEFEAIIAAVIGGSLLTGGYGSVIGGAFGALIFGVVQIGIFYTGADSSLFRVFLGLMLLAAVIFNNYLRFKVTGESM